VCLSRANLLHLGDEMHRLTTKNESDLEQATLDSLEPVRMGGKISDVYLQFANSEIALRAYLQMEESARAGSLSDLEIEAIKLLVSEKNRCDYCLSVHDMKARKLGLDTESRLSVRRAESTGNARIDAITMIANEFFSNPGPLSDDLVERGRSAGLCDREFVDIGMAVATIFFTNIVNHVNNTQASLPPAPRITG